MISDKALYAREFGTGHLTNYDDVGRLISPLQPDNRNNPSLPRIEQNACDVVAAVVRHTRRSKFHLRTIDRNISYW
jgi:hypothetical protein